MLRSFVSVDLCILVPLSVAGLLTGLEAVACDKITPMPTGGKVTHHDGKNTPLSCRLSVTKPDTPFPHVDFVLTNESAKAITIKYRLHVLDHLSITFYDADMKQLSSFEEYGKQLFSSSIYGELTLKPGESYRNTVSLEMSFQDKQYIGTVFVKAVYRYGDFLAESPLLKHELARNHR